MVAGADEKSFISVCIIKYTYVVRICIRIEKSIRQDSMRCIRHEMRFDMMRTARYDLILHSVWCVDWSIRYDTIRLLRLGCTTSYLLSWSIESVEADEYILLNIVPHREHRVVNKWRRGKRTSLYVVIRRWSSRGHVLQTSAAASDCYRHIYSRGPQFSAEFSADFERYFVEFRG